MFKRLLVLFAVFVSANSFAACEQLLPWGLPKTPQHTIELCQIAYYTAFDPQTKNPSFSAELLLYENVSGIENRKGSFKKHPLVPSNQQATARTYSGFSSENRRFDRGHLAAPRNMRKDSVAMIQSFYYTNILPQTVALNRGEWSSLEGSVGSHVKEERPLYVISGAIYEKRPPETLGSSGNWVPTHTYKLVYDKVHNKLATYVLPNTDEVSGAMKTFYVPYETVEKLTGNTFFPDMPDDIRKALIQGPMDKAW